MPCRAGCLERTWGFDPESTAGTPSADTVNAVGAVVIIEYRVHRGFYNTEPVALSDGIGNGGCIVFTVGDGSVNAAVDELVRTLPPKIIRRAVVPAAFDLDRGTRAEYPRVEPPGTTYL